MFDIGFWELVIIGLVALLVVGPERLPKLAYTAGKWLGKGRAMIGSIKSEIDREMQADELKRVVEEQKAMLNPLEEIIEETENSVNQCEQETNATLVDYGSEDQEAPESAAKPDTSRNEIAK
jgi:sec-independent protein translocase protein TatB